MARRCIAPIGLIGSGVTWPVMQPGGRMDRCGGQRYLTKCCWI
jgi:hypothetical protein